MNQIETKVVLISSAEEIPEGKRIAHEPKEIEENVKTEKDIRVYT